MRQQILMLSFLLIVTSLFAQDVRVYTESDGKGGYKILAEKKKPGSVTIEVSFTELTGYRLSGSNPLVQTVNGSNENIGTLTRETNGFSANFRYTYKTYTGRNLSKADTLYPYLMPVKAGDPVVTSGSYYIGDVVGKQSNNYYAIGFIFPMDDTVYAARAGTVISTTLAETSKGEQELYNSKSRTTLLIEQEDGTLARYNFVHPVRSTLEPGDFVVPGQPIAVFSGSLNSNTLLFSVSYLDVKFTDDNGSHYKMIRPKFHTETNPSELLLPGMKYTSVHPYELITRELSNKQKKKLGLSNKQ